VKKLINQLDILKKALIEFAKNGYQKASTNAIARQANVSKGSIFNYFESKKNLFQRVMEYSIEQFKKSVHEFTIQSIKPKEIVLDGIYFLKKFYDDNPEIYDLYMKIVYSKNVPDRKSVKRVVKLFSSSITLKIIDRFKSQGYISDYNELKEELLIYYLNAVISRLVEGKFFDIDILFDKEEYLDQIASFITYGIIPKKDDDPAV